MVETRRLTQLTADVAARCRWPDPPFVVALSGGADSSALAALASDRGETRALHVHHGLDASDSLAAAAEEIAAVLSIAFEVLHVEIPPGPSPEDRARTARYSALDHGTSATDSVLVGHTMDDQAETVLLNLVRGAGTSGLAGIPYFRPPNIYRPMLRVTRSETREMAVLRQLPFVDDPTNLDLSLTRNVVRHRLIPMTRDINPGSTEALARAARHLEEDAVFLDALAEGAVRAEIADGRIDIPVGALVALSPVIAARVIRARVGHLRDGNGASAAETERVLEVVSGSASGCEISGGIKVSRQGPYLRLERDPEG